MNMHWSPAPAAGQIQDADAIIQFEDVRKAFGAHEREVVALRDVSLEIGRGEIAGIIGRSGAGKSTLVRLVNGLEKPTSGRIVVDGIEVSALPEAGLRQARRSIGMVFQHFNLLSSRSAYQNVALPLEIAGLGRAEIRKRVEPLLSLVGLEDKRDRYPSELSGGQKQRVGIARALATEPKVLLSDEATSALDPETTRSILELLARIHRELNVTILLITHEMHVVKEIAQRVAVMDGGRIVEHGATFDVFTRPHHATTRTFLEGVTGAALPEFLVRELQADPVPNGRAVVRILFTGPHATDPVLARLSRQLDMEVNILAGSVDEIGGQPFGTLVVSLPNAEPRLGEALAFLQGLGLRTEVLGHVA